MICAGCGRAIVKARDGRWGEVIRGTADDPRTINYVCDYEEEGGRLLWADYHYVQGEEQQHFRAAEQ